MQLEAAEAQQTVAHDARAEAVALRGGVVGDGVGAVQRGEQAMRGRLGNADAASNLGDADRLLGVGEVIDDGERLGQRLTRLRLAMSGSAAAGGQRVQRSSSFSLGE